MSNPFDDTYAAIQAAEEQLRAADQTAYKMAKVLVGRLRKVDDTYVLRALKHELRDFDAREGKWRSE